jgi:hypothetical protein
MAMINLDEDEYAELHELAISVNSAPVAEVLDWMHNEWKNEGKDALGILAQVLDVVIRRPDGLFLIAARTASDPYDGFGIMLDAINDYNER